MTIMQAAIIVGITINFNLSIKVMAAFNFAQEHCSRAGFILRTAADNAINIPNILHTIKANDKFSNNPYLIFKQ